jgi:peptide/nickel transport system permease protein
MNRLRYSLIIGAVFFLSFASTRALSFLLSLAWGWEPAFFYTWLFTAIAIALIPTRREPMGTYLAHLITPGTMLAVSVTLRLLTGHGQAIAALVFYAYLLLALALVFAWTRSGAMKNYLTRRLLLIVPTFLGITLISFFVIQIAPGNPINLRLMKLQGAMAAESAPEEIIERTKKLYGLDKPLPVQYALWLKRVATLDFGKSYKDQRPVLTKIGEALPITLQLNIISILLIYLISTPIGVFSATHPSTWRDAALTFVLFVLYSLPSFWVAMLLIYFLGGGQFLDWFPTYGLSSQGAANFTWCHWILDRAWHYVLPVFCLTYGGLAGLSRYARAGMVDVIRQDYIRTARAYGFSEKIVVFKYAMRNSLIPIITLLGTLLPALLGGSVIIERIFSIPGMGRLGFEAVLSRDYPLVMGILTISALLTLVSLILSDILYAIVDPRIRFE